MVFKEYIRGITGEVIQRRKSSTFATLGRGGEHGIEGNSRTFATFKASCNGDKWIAA